MIKALSQADALTPAQRRRAVEVLCQERQPWEGLAAVGGTRGGPRSRPDLPALPSPARRAVGQGPWLAALPLRRLWEGGKTFNALSGTPLARLRHRERWGEYAQALIDGDTVRGAARRCGVHKNTAFRWRHRFLARSAGLKPSRLHGIVEADATYSFSEKVSGI
jgi:hypothetical protein